MLFSELDRPRGRGGFFKKLFILFNLLMIVNVLTIKHIENIQDKEPPQEVADLGGDKNDFINQQEQSLSKVRVPLGIAESGLDRALLAFVAEYNQLYSLLNTHRYNIWIAGVLLFFGVSMLLRRI